MPPVIPIATAALGLYQTISSMSALNKLKKQALPSYTDPKNMAPLLKTQQMYQQRFDQGLSPEENASFLNNMRSSVAGSVRSVSDLFGKSAGGALAATVGNSMRNAFMDLAKLNAAARQNAMGGLSSANSAIAGQYNRQTAQDYNYRMAAENAYGKAMQQGLKNIVDPINFGIMSGQFSGGSGGGNNVNGSGVTSDMISSWFGNPYARKGTQTWDSTQTIDPVTGLPID